jgi:hypothetical protein
MNRVPSHDPIRDAVHELVASAPSPKALTVLSAEIPRATPRSNRWMAIAGAAAAVVIGTAAIVVWNSARDTPVTDDSTLPVSLAPQPTSSVPTTTTATTPTTPDTQPPTTAAVITVPAEPGNAPASLVDPVPILITSLPLPEIPGGSLELGDLDVIAAHSDHDLWWYPGLLGEDPGEPIRLLDYPDPPGGGEIDINFVESVADTIDGALVYGDCCEPVSGSIRAVTEPASASIELGVGWTPASSGDGRLAIVNFAALQVWDFARNKALSRDISDLEVTPNSLVWSVDRESLFVTAFDNDGVWRLIEFSSRAPFRILGQTALDVPTNDPDHIASAEIAGLGPSGEVVLHIRSGGTSRLQSYDPGLMRPMIGEIFDGDLGIEAQAVRFTSERLILYTTTEGELRVRGQIGVGDHTLIEGGVSDAWIPARVSRQPEREITPEQQVVEDYLDALAEGRYADAATLLGSSAVEDEMRSDLQPLRRQFGTTDDLAGLLERWCTEVTVCDAPALVYPIDDWIVTTHVVHRLTVATGFYRAGFFEGVPGVRGLPPRRHQMLPNDTACPTPERITNAVEADLDGDGAPETVVLSAAAGRQSISFCNTATVIASAVLPDDDDNRRLAVLDTDADGSDELWLATPTGTGMCGTLLGLDGATWAETDDVCFSNFTTGFGCETVDGRSRLVHYDYTIIGSDLLEAATGLSVDVSDADGPIEHRDLVLPAQVDDALRIVNPYCGEFPVLFFDG